MLMKRLLLLLAAVALVSAGCNNSPTAPSPFNQTVNGSIGSFAYLSHDLTTPRAGVLTITLTWPAGDGRDLDLYVTPQDCQDIYGEQPCTFLEESFASVGTSETITRAVQSGEPFRIWIDSFSFSDHAYTLQIGIQ